MSINGRLRSAFEIHARRAVLHYEANALSGAELDRASGRLAAGLTRCGIGRSDRVAFLLPNGPELVLLDLACLRLGAVAVPLNVRLKGPELAWIVNHSQARLCVASPELLPTLLAMRPELPTVERFFMTGGGPSPEGVEPFDALSDPDACPPPWLDLPDDAPAAILYTSGTTARPKGVTHTHGSLDATTRFFVEAARLGPDDVVLGMLSMGHIFGFTLQLLSPLTVGAAVVLSANFDPTRVFDLIGRLRVTHLYGLPVMFDALTRQPQAAAGALTLKYCLAGGDAVSPALSAAMRTSLGLDLHEGCGMTEVIPYALNRPGIENRVGTIGKQSVGMEVRAVDEQGNDVLDGQPGEMIVRSPALMAGYWNDAEATAASIRDGWFHTGDVGRRDTDGYWWFVGRRKEIIVRGGSNIAPPEVEGVLSLHPAVLEAAVVGTPHPVLGETVTAFVALKPGTTATAEELQRFVGERIAAYKVPERVVFLPDLPRGATGKIHRKTLKEIAGS